MGLTIHYRLRGGCIPVAEARALVGKLRAAALDLPFAAVTELIELTGEECLVAAGAGDDPLRWLKIQAQHHLRLDPEGERFAGAPPYHLIAFMAGPGPGCEPANVGLALYPERITADGRELATGLSGWCWESFCKTQYASNPDAGGMENFLRCHQSVVRLLDAAAGLGILAEVTDEGGYWDKRDADALAGTVAEWNELTAGFAGSLRDDAEAGGAGREKIQAEIFAFPDFEHLEAKGRLERDVGPASLQWIENERNRDMSNGSLADRLAVCSWSLRPAGPAELIEQLKQLEMTKVQLALDPLRDQAEWADTGTQLAGAGVEIVSGMFGCVGEDYSTLESIRRTGGIVPDQTWEQNWANIQGLLPIARDLGVTLLTFHAGFLPEEPQDPSYQKLTGRLARIAELFAGAGIDLAFETGQEEAATLKGFLDGLGLPSIGVNFDPANMILYGKGDPVASVRVLLSYLRGVHVKDALPTETPGEWGTEVVVGTGAVDWPAFFAALNAGGFAGYLSIEREAGDQRVADVAAARDFVVGTVGAG